MKSKWSIQKLIYTGMLAAIAGALMSLEFSVPLMPPFYKVDFHIHPKNQKINGAALFGAAPQSVEKGNPSFGKQKKRRRVTDRCLRGHVPRKHSL